MSKSKHILDLRKKPDKKQPVQDTTEIFDTPIFQTPDNIAEEKKRKSKKDLFDLDIDVSNTEKEGLWDMLRETTRKEFKRQKDFEPVARLTQKHPEFNVKSKFLDDITFALANWYRQIRRRRQHQGLDLSKAYNYSKKSNNLSGFAYNSVASFGWLLEKIIFLFLEILRFIKAIVFSPIKVLDKSLDFLAHLVGVVLKLIWRLVSFGLKALLRQIKDLRFNPPYFWYKKIGVFALMAALIVAPIKLFFEVPKILNAKQEVLGISTKAIGNFAIFNELKDYLPAAQVAKEFAGFAGPRRYLLVFQNNAELRPTGGFMGSYALVDIKEGKIQQMDVPTGGFYDLKGSFARQIEAPEPFHVFSPYWQIWNANWFADFPTSAHKLAQFYEMAGGPTVDGVVTITPDVIEDLLGLVGPIEIPEYDTVIDKNNFRRQTQVEVELEYDEEKNTPKAFIGDLAPQLLAKTFAYASDPDKVRDLLEVIDKALEEKQLLLYSTRPEVQDELAGLNWAGKIRDSSFDYLQVVNTNIGGGKTDLVIKDQLSQKINIQNDGSVLSIVSLTRTHQGDSQDIFEGHDNLDYVRFYVPQGAKLLSAEGFLEDDITARFKSTEEELEQDPDLASLQQALVDLPSGTQIYDESGKTVFANWLSLKPGQSKTVTIKYKLPNAYDFSQPYQIYWQKQAGTKGTPMNVSISLPADKQFVSWLPQDSHINLISDYELSYSNDLRVDRYLSFTVN